MQREKRTRAIGAGRKYKLELHSQLVLTLVWLHLYLTTEMLGLLFGVDKATVSRNTRRVVGALRQLGEDTVWWYEPPDKSEGKSLEQVLVEHPDLLAVLDAMEVNVQRAPRKLPRKRHIFSIRKRPIRAKWG